MVNLCAATQKGPGVVGRHVRPLPLLPISANIPSDVKRLWRCVVRVSVSPWNFSSDAKICFAPIAANYLSDGESLCRHPKVSVLLGVGSEWLQVSIFFFA
jgi:hypothetical protein